MSDFITSSITVKFSEVAEALGHFRHEAGLTLEEVAEGMNCSFPSVSHYQTGRRRPSLKVIEKLARLYGYDVTLTFTRR